MHVCVGGGLMMHDGRPYLPLEPGDLSFGQSVCLGNDRHNVHLVVHRLHEGNVQWLQAENARKTNTSTVSLQANYLNQKKGQRSILPTLEAQLSTN